MRDEPRGHNSGSDLADEQHLSSSYSTRLSTQLSPSLSCPTPQNRKHPVRNWEQGIMCRLHQVPHRLTQQNQVWVTYLSFAELALIQSIDLFFDIAENKLSRKREREASLEPVTTPKAIVVRLLHILSLNECTELFRLVSHRTQMRANQGRGDPQLRGDVRWTRPLRRRMVSHDRDQTLVHH